MKGLVHIYTGNGKGKTTAALGLGIRAFGAGFRVLMVQFLKGSETGELKVIEQLGSGFELRREKEIKKFIWNMNDEEKAELKKSVNNLYHYALREGLSGSRDMLIMDEIMGTLSNGLIEVEDIIKLIKEKPGHLEIVLTGRKAPRELIDLADYVSEINMIKHPFEQGIPARKGIEF